MKTNIKFPFLQKEMQNKQKIGNFLTHSQEKK